MNKLFTLLSLVVLFSNSSMALTTENENNLLPKSNEMTTGLNHLGLTVKNLQDSADFFINTLGWKKVEGFPNYPSIFVTDGELFLTLWQTKDANNVVTFDRKNNVGLHHLALSVASKEALIELHRRFKSVPNLIIEFAPELNGKGPTVHMMIREPSGNRIEFAFTPPRDKG